MKIVKLEENDFREALALSEYAFQYKVPEEEIEERLKRFERHHILSIFDQEQLAAKLHIIPFEIFLGKEKMNMGGVASVATYPEYRRNGYVKALIESALSYMKENGYSISMLHPFDVSFYRKYGWELFSNHLKSTLKKKDLVPMPSPEGAIKRFKKEGHGEDVEQVYEQYAKQFSGMLVRHRDWWLQSVYSDLYAAVYYDVSQNPSGYMLYKVKDSKMTVEEFVVLTNDARKGLWNFICQHDSMVEQVEMVTSEREELFFTLRESRIQQEIKPYFMVRIVDVEAFLNQYPFQWSKAQGQVVLRVEDSYAPWNNKCYVLEDGKVTVLSETETDPHNLHLSVQSLAAMLFGYKRPTQLHQIERINGNERQIEQLEQLIPDQKPFFYDFF
ncbi:GNAT family N-acetyltransferase [Bacillus sp. FJAT-47783]|uniref:GNAT family N-acetyltransferase n=1 Tax=Bacillus sp. FJAT-47783 TaxID=2922712 RepID=UPI001FACD9BD|nr:GNAT family N-acetyltransferase [Bacillus sp. FJAT-47783]